ncbi:putative RNA-dependent RNA polymerase [Lyophyllum shimeji]|uniref:RNA-dependent RNA polymerase n=1 Tax=Lyophyllum shimeji TaxID=47721 RepID=A0A9P3PVE5_LYOSH|nr:putative RNA-dependent RNA polymerase [Lyophyllum shimeji]
MRRERNRSSVGRESSPTSEYEGYCTDFDDEDCKAADAIESAHNSPVKELSTLSYSSLPILDSNKSPSSHSFWGSKSEGATAYSSSSRQRHQYPITPSRKVGTPSAVTGTPGTSRRLDAIQRSFDELGLKSPALPTPKKLFPEASAKGKQPLPVIDIPDDTDDEAEEVTKILTDTETSADEWAGLTPVSTGDSLSSISSGWSLPSKGSFKLTTFATKKRTGDPQSSSHGSPSKYRKLADREATTIHKELSRPQVVNDVFSQMSTSASSSDAGSASRHDGWKTHDPTEDFSALKEFLAGPLGADLNPVIIAHDKEVQPLMDEAGIAWGVQYEIAHGISRGYWQWSDVKAKLAQLKGKDARSQDSAHPVSNKDTAHRVRSIMLGVRQKPSDTSIWEELDREQDAILENCERGLGLRGTWRDEPDWYGGRVQQLARLAHHEGTYKIHLDPMEKRRSYRMARHYASRRILQLRIPDEMILKEGEKVKQFLLQKFVLCGRVFVPFFAKENGVYLVETDEDYERRPVAAFGDNYRKSLKALIQWHNDLELNKDQPIAKWYMRSQLAFSDSIPALEFEEENIHAIPDIYAPWSGPGKPPAEKIHTDGCGLINAAALKIIAALLGLSHLPSAVQGRLEGSKGLWLLHPTDKSPEPRIWIRTSQKKIIYRYPLSRAHRIFDLLSVSRFSPPIKLSKQSIMNLSENGVGDGGVVALYQPAGGRVEEQAVEADDGAGEGVGAAAQGVGHQDIGMETEEDSLNALEDEQEGAYTGRNEISGAPLSLHEVALELIQAGFRPDKLKPLRDKIRCIVETTIKSIVDKFSIPLPESLGAFIVPDPLGILEQGEIYYRSSQSLTDPETQTLFNVVTGDVLLGRYPVRLPSDIQKVKAVDRPELFKYTDVIIVSTKGNVSLASLLAGGDCDGDDLFMIREKCIVEPFESKPLTAMPPKLLSQYFEGHPERVEQFAERVTALSSPERQKAFQEILLLSLNDSKVGLYSMFHDFSVWKHGYASTESVRLAYMFNTLLDSGKTGLRLKPGVFEKDRARFGYPVPETQQGNSRRFIFHTLRSVCKAASDALLRDYDILGSPSSRDVKDGDLIQPYETINDHALRYYENHTNEHRRLLTDELVRIRAVVEVARDAYSDALSRLGAAKEKADQSGSPTKKTSKKKSQREADPFLRASKLFDQDVPDVFLIQNIREIKASYAYTLYPPFAFSVAFRDLCVIKAQASAGGIAPIIRSFDQAKTIPSTYIKAVARLTADRL